MQSVALMSPGGLVHRIDVEKAPDLVHQVRGLSFFRRHIAHGVASIGRREGLPARFDEHAAPGLFLNWIAALMAQKAYAHVDRRDYIVFGAGMLLKALLEEKPIRLLAPLRLAGSRDPLNAGASVWPEGFLAMSYCLSVLDAVLDQEGLETFTLSPLAGDESVWQSFRENVTGDARLAIPYLDLLIGNEPNWVQPTWARSRPAQVRIGGCRLLS